MKKNDILGTNGLARGKEKYGNVKVRDRSKTEKIVRHIKWRKTEISGNSESV